jgi:hypothetical protein
MGLMRPGLFAALLLLVLLVGCGVEKTEKARISNVSQTVDAVITENYGDATVPSATGVYLVAHGAQMTVEPLFIGDYVEGLKVNWTSDLELKISGNKARVYKERMPKDPATVQAPAGKSYVVRIKLEINDLTVR